MASPLNGPANPAPARFQEAVDAFRALVAVDGATWGGMTAHARARAFGVAGLAQLSLVQDVWRALEKAVADGETLEDFKRRIGPQVRAAWGGTVSNPGHRLETIFRTNLATAYSRGTWQQLQDPLTRRVRPYILSQVPRDERNSDVCRKGGTVVLPADDPYWLTHWSPWHFRCRRTQSALTERQAKARGITSPPPMATPDAGFGAAPGTPGDSWTPDASDAPPPLQAAFRAKQDAGPPPPGPDERLPYGPIRGDSAELVTEALPHLAAALGDRLRVDGAADSEGVRLAAEELAALPSALLARVRAATTDIHISSKSVPYLGASGRAGQAMRAAGMNVDGSTWEANAGAFFADDKVREVLVSGDGLSGCASVVLHEVGHALDTYSGDRSTPAWIAAWESMRVSAVPAASADYYTREDVGAAETFAEAFGVFWAAGGGEYGTDRVRDLFGAEVAEYMRREYGRQAWGSR